MPIVIVKTAKTAESAAIAPKEPVNLDAESTKDTTAKKGFFSAITGMAVNGLKAIPAMGYGIAAFLLITRNDKFFSKLLFTLFTFSIALWGWTNILAEFYALIQYATLLAQIAYATGMSAIFLFFLIALETSELHLGLKIIPAIFVPEK